MLIIGKYYNYCPNTDSLPSNLDFHPVQSYRVSRRNRAGVEVTKLVSVKLAGRVKLEYLGPDGFAVVSVPVPIPKSDVRLCFDWIYPDFLAEI